MKNEVNFLPQKTGRETDTAGKKNVQKFSFGILTVFLIFNLMLFGFFFFLRKNTDLALAEINRQEMTIANLSKTEALYRKLKLKLSFLTLIWQKPRKINESLAFVNGLIGAEAALLKMNFDEDGLVTLNLTSPNSSDLELFLERTQQKEQEGKLKELKINSVSRDEDDPSPSVYKFILSFKLKP